MEGFVSEQYELVLPCTLEDLQERLQDIRSIDDKYDIHFEISTQFESPQLVFVINRPETPKERKSRISKLRMMYRNNIIENQKKLEELSNMV